MTVKFLDLYKQYQTIKEEVQEVIENTIKNSSYIGGPYLKEFEQNFAKFHDTKYCVGVGNGTDAIEIAIESLQLPKGSEIIVPANSFIASSEAVTTAGHRVVFCDCNTENYTICPESLESKITEKTKAIVAVHLYGHPADMDKVMAIAKKHNLKVIEDSAQAHGAEYKGKRIGGFGDLATFSFYPGKNLGAYGDGGAIITNNKDLSDRCRLIANHGSKEKYKHLIEGRNSRLDGMQAGILNVKLKHLDDWSNRRIAIADMYLELLKDCKGLTLPKREDWARQVYHLFVIRTEKREELKQFLADNDIHSGIHYPISLPKLEAYSYTEQANEDFFANKTDIHLLSLPMGEHLEDSEIKLVAQKVKEFFA